MSNTIAHRPHVHHVPWMSTVLAAIVAVAIAAIAITYSASQSETSIPITASTAEPPAPSLVLTAGRYDTLRHRMELQRSWTYAAGGSETGITAAPEAGGGVAPAVRFDNVPRRLSRELSKRRP